MHFRMHIQIHRRIRTRIHIRIHIYTYTHIHTYTHIWMWNALNQTIVKFLDPCKSCFLLWKLRFSVASWHVSGETTTKPRRRDTGQGGPPDAAAWFQSSAQFRVVSTWTAGFLPPLRHMLLHLLTLTILLDSAWFSLENRSVCLMLLGSLLKIDQWSILKREPSRIKQKITISAHSLTYNRPMIDFP